MRSRFSAPTTSKISVSRTVEGGGVETVDFSVNTLPAGWMECLRAQFDIPTPHVDGKPVDPQPGAVAEYRNQLAALTIAKALEESGELDTRLPQRTVTRHVWAQTANKVLEEFTAAGYTTAEMAYLHAEVVKANESVERVRAADRMARAAKQGNG